MTAQENNVTRLSITITRDEFRDRSFRTMESEPLKELFSKQPVLTLVGLTIIAEIEKTLFEEE